MRIRRGQEYWKGLGTQFRITRKILATDTRFF